MNNLNFEHVLKARQRIKDYIEKTPVISNKVINAELGAQVFFKMENQQKVRAFKARGAFNALLSYREEHGEFPQKVVAHSSGNHAQAVAIACKEFGIEALIYMINNKTEIMLINEESSKVVSVEDFNKYSHYLAEEIKSLKESINSLTESRIISCSSLKSSGVKTSSGDS